MPGTSKTKNPRGIEIEFTEATHIYKSIIDGKEIRYISGTGFLKSYFPPFDPTGKITEACARKEGLTVDQIKAKWKAKGDASCHFGTRVHEVVEDVVLGRAALRNEPENDKERLTFGHAKRIAQKFRQNLDILGVEKIVFDPDLKIAGTIDLFARSRKDGSYLVIDHKTNSEIVQENKYNNFCLDPIAHVPAVNFHEYALQLNLYCYLLKYGKYVPKDAKFRFFLNHLTEEKANLIELPNYQSEIKDLIIDYLVK